jgi:multicomponent K+:H+ antiporter subunit G
MAPVLEVVATLLLVTGGAFLLIGAIGVARFPDVLTRMHAAGLAGTLGIGALLLASMLVFAAEGHEPGVRELAIVLCIVLVAPVASLCIARAARRRGE